MLEPKINTLVTIEENIVNLSGKKSKPNQKSLLGWNKDTLTEIKNEFNSEQKTNIANGKYSVANSFIINATEANILVEKVFFKVGLDSPIWTSHLTPREVLSLMIYAINISGDITYNNYGKNVELPVPTRSFYINNFGGWGKALELVGLTKNKIEVKSKVIALTKEQELELTAKGIEYAISIGTKKAFWGSDLMTRLKQSVDPKLKTTIANGKYSIYSDFVITQEEAEKLSLLTYINCTNWHFVLTPKEILSLLAYSINVSGFCSTTNYRDDVTIKIPCFRFYYTHFGSWLNALSLLGLTEN